MRITGAIACLLALTISSLPAKAAEIRVYAAGVLQDSQREIAAEFTKATGTAVAFTFGNGRVTQERVKNGEPADVVMISQAGLDTLAKEGVVKPETVAMIGSASVGVAVRAGAPVPDISTLEKLRAALLAVKSITYNDPKGGSVSGTLVARTIERLGIADQVAKKAVFVDGDPTDLVVRGEVEMTIQQLSEIIAINGITIVGPLPAELGATTIYGAAVPAKSESAADAIAFIAYLRRPQSAEIMKRHGILPAPNP